MLKKKRRKNKKTDSTDLVKDTGNVESTEDALKRATDAQKAKEAVENAAKAAGAESCATRIFDGAVRGGLGNNTSIVLDKEYPQVKKS